MIRAGCTSAAELRLGGCRLDGSYYASDGARAWRLIESTGVPADPLATLCIPGGLYIPHRFKRPYVQDPKYGIPYITGSSIGLADPLQNCSYLSSRPGAIPGRDSLMLKPRTILVTASGIPGVAIYVNDLFVGTVGSPDLVRVIADTAKTRVGYLYTFLSSPMGRAMLARGTYGGVIPHIEAEHIVDLPIPRLTDPLEEAIHERVEAAAAKRVEANRKLWEARERVYEVTGLPRFDAPVGRNLAGFRTYIASQSSLGTRFEARYHDTVVQEMRASIRATRSYSKLHEVTRSVHEESRHKLFDAAENCVPLVGTGEMFSAKPSPHRRVSLRIPDIESLRVDHGTILIAKSGQIYSILGDVVMAGRSLVGVAVSWHALRVIPDPAALHPGYVFAFLSLPDYGYGQIASTAYGTSIPELSTNDIKQMLVAMPNEDERNTIGEEVLRAVGLRDQANDLEDEAQALLDRALDEATGGAWSNLARTN